MMDKVIPTNKTNNVEKDRSLNREDISSQEIPLSSKIMNDPDKEKKSEQHIKLCESPNFMNNHGLLNSSPLYLNTKINNGEIRLWLS